MKKPNYILLALIAFAFACSVVSMAEETPVSPSQKLKENIEKYAKEKEISDSLQAQWEYHKATPKEEWLPIWREILLNGTLAESVTNWLDFAKVPFYFLYQAKPHDPNFLAIATDFKKLCEEPDHFTLDDFVDMLLKVRTDGNCCYPAGNLFYYPDQSKQKTWATKNSYHFYNVCDVLRLLGSTKELEKIISAWLEELKKADYKEFVQTSYKSRCLGDIDSTFNDIPLIKGSTDDPYYDHDINVDWAANQKTIKALLFLKDADSIWLGLSGLANHCGMQNVFVKGLKEAAEIHSNYFPLAKLYCDTLCRYDDRETAREFLKKFYPFEKIRKMPCAYEGYFYLCKNLEIPLRRSRTEPRPDGEVVMWQLYSHADRFCEWGKWFWEIRVCF